MTLGELKEQIRMLSESDDAEVIVLDGCGNDYESLSIEGDGEGNVVIFSN